MFSGIIEQKAKILEINKGEYTVENLFNDDIKIGQSIAHDGACMTVISFDKNKYTFFAMGESLEKTNFLSKKVGDYFNIERCVKAGDRLDGHIVSGHIDTIGKVIGKDFNEDKSLNLTVGFNDEFSKYLIPKGSITINGVSLTIVNETNDSLKVCLITITQDITNLGDLKIGEEVNLEFDIVGKYIYKNKNI